MTDKLAWLALQGIPGIGPVLFHRLVEAFGSPARVFQTPFSQLCALRGISDALAQTILDFRHWDRVEEHLSRLRTWGAEIITLDDPGYPLRLTEIPFPPPVLFVKGEIKPEDSLALAMVGTRNASYYGKKTCRSLARELARRGVTIVSGLARGIDTVAHQGALEGGGRTLAVLGCGLDVVYPPENRELYGLIPENGALITEYPLGAPPEAHNFPRRNRIISGLALGVLVVEAGLKSGTQITAQCALDQNREVLAVPGPVNSPTSAGPHRLIQTGAKLVQNVDDILAELPQAGGPIKAKAGAAPELPRRPGPVLFAKDDPLLPLLGAAPLQLEELVQASHLPAAEVMSRLTLLELQGLVRELPGKCYVLQG
jgi:DNA processing protein|uniref:DNA-protecting protein DprA n=1 Tax=Desulfobacca acetoxidans TaxID=60893 RepID=A0A7V6A2W2_9BACT